MISPLAEGAALLGGFALAVEPPLLAALASVVAEAPFRHMVTPGSFTMSVAMTNCGAAGWVTDRRGYRYDAIDPESRRPWPSMPAAFDELARWAAEAAGFGGFAPDACLINRYEPGARLSLHQDKDEWDIDAPIVSVSLGLPATFLFGGPKRSDPARRVALRHGDVAVWGGPSRLAFHGIMASPRASIPCWADAASTSPFAGRCKVQTLLLTHPAFLRHETGPLHPERPARMRAIDAALSQPAFAALRREEAPWRDDAEAAILLAHSHAYLERVRAIAANRDRLPARIGPDTVIAEGTWEAALRAVGAGLYAIDTVMDPASGIANAFCQVRPPGHHAERDRGMGFCLFSTAAIAGLYARARHGAWRVAVIDLDVHHGNGTQEIFWSDSDMFYGSTHEMPLFPGTGATSERGVGNICNAPLRAGDSGAAFRAVFEGRILPALESFRPDLILVSAGFDAHRDDPLANLRLLEPDFAWATDRIVGAAHRHCGGRIVSFLEGGYQLDALARSTAAHVEALMRGAG